MFPWHRGTRHQTCNFSFSYLNLIFWSLACRRSTFCIWGDEFRHHRKRKYMKGFATSHQLLAISSFFFFITSSDSHTCAFFPWETAGAMPFVLLADSCFWCRHTTAFCVLEALPQPGKRLFEFRPLGQSIVLASARSEHNIPTEKVISCSDLASAPFIKGPHRQKHKAVKGPSPPGGTWQSQQKTEDVGTGSGKAHSPKASYHHDPSPALWFCMNRNRATISSYAEACPRYVIQPVRIMDENFMHLRDWCLMKHDWACRLKLEIRCVAYK